MAIRRKAGRVTAMTSAWRASRWGLACVVVFTTVFNLLKFASPLYLLQVLDRVPASRSIETLIMLTIAVVIAISCGLALDVVRQRMMVRWGVWIERQFGPRMVHRGLADGRAAEQAAEIGRALGDVTKLRLFVTGTMLSWLDVMFAPLFFFGIFLIHPLLGVIGVVSLALLLILGVIHDWLTREPRRASSDAYRETTALVQAAERNRESVGALSMAPSITDRWQRTSSSRLEERERIAGRQALLRTLMKGLGQFLRIAMIAVGIWLVVVGPLTLGGIFAARVMAGFGYALAERAVRNYRNLRETITAYESVKQSLTDEDVVRASLLPGTTEAPLVLDDVNFRHRGQRNDLYRHVSLTLAPGELLVVNGTAGTGKTTFSRLLVGLLQPRHGQVRLGEVNIARLPDHVRAKLVGYMPQHTELFSGTVRENIARMGEGEMDKVIAAAKLVGVHDMIVHMAEGYDTVISGDTFGMSGSERKRLALARAFYDTPRLIVLDEPSANLDVSARRIMEAALKSLKANGASIVVTQSIHSSQITRLADRFLILGGKSHKVTDNLDKQAAKQARDHLRSVK